MTIDKDKIDVGIEARLKNFNRLKTTRYVKELHFNSPP